MGLSLSLLLPFEWLNPGVVLYAVNWRCTYGNLIDSGSGQVRKSGFVRSVKSLPRELLSWAYPALPPPRIHPRPFFF